ncbi:glutathione S-transferase [Roseibium sp. CAU 1637]|uniref:Glutathione S-transferase n=1 Tax=Roseibium limicola TaxID=2816037 RepID=A0A939EPE3_9HYPH|nr:glutathione S-transferase [Roseibium limicola]MBO0345885.1 glutathione S-transferase [Roseibium limicola]
MKIWGRINSSNVRKVLWCAEELGLAYQQIDAGGAFGLVDTPEFRALNPNGRIPCLQDGDFVLWESNTIVRYLVRKYGSGDILPDSLEQWASADRWMDWTTFSFGDPFKDLFWNMVRTTPDARDHAALEAGLKHCAAQFAVADAVLAKQPYLSGEALGIGDIPLGSLAYAWFAMEIERPDLPHLATWYQHLCDREAYRKGVMSPLT